jgi:hypothetical protein
MSYGTKTKTVVLDGRLSHQYTHTLTIATLNDLEVKVGDVLNACITAPVKEKVWTVLGPEFGHDAGKSAIIVRALYGLKSAVQCFELILLPLCTKWDMHPVMLTPTCG